MKNSLVFLVFTCFLLPVHAQTAEDSIKSIINQLFTAMKNCDTVLLKDCFADSAILQTITSRGKVGTDDVNEFAKQIASLPKAMQMNESHLTY